MAGMSAPNYDRDCDNSPAFKKVLIVSVAFHVLLLIVLPLMTKLFWKPAKFERPKTFQLVQVPVPPAPPRKVPVEKPAPKPEPKPEVKPQPKPEPKPTPEPKPQPESKPVESKPVEEPTPAPQEDEARPVEENLDELAELFSELPAPAQVSAPSDFKYHWYLNNVRQKIEMYWKPPTEDKTLSVVVRFMIHIDGSISGLSITESSGNSTLDNLAKRAVTIAAPFGKLPPGFSGDQLDISCTLRPTRN